MNTRKLSAFAAKYKYVLIILLVGLILLLLPTGSKTKTKSAQTQPVSEQTQTQTIQAEEQRLTQLLQQINGAGQVQVLLSYRCIGRAGAGDGRRRRTDHYLCRRRGTGGSGAQDGQSAVPWCGRCLRRGRLAAGAARRHAGSGTVYRPEHRSHFRAQKAAGFAIKITGGRL